VRQAVNISAGRLGFMGRISVEEQAPNRIKSEIGTTLEGFEL
jgi:hypothetical protein